MPDDQQPFRDLPTGECGVLGLQVLVGIQSLHWNREGTIEVGFAPGSRCPRTADMCFEGGQVVIEAEYRQSKINILLDTGATRTRALPMLAPTTAARGLQFEGRFLFVGMQRPPLPTPYVYSTTDTIALYDLGK